MSKTATQKAPKKASKHHEQTFVDVLHEDHERVKALFKKFEETDNKKQKQKIVHEVIAELKVHAQVEEEVVYPALREVVEEDLMNEADEEHHVAKVLIAELENYGSED